jgi:hypothetical protein
MYKIHKSYLNLNASEKFAVIQFSATFGRVAQFFRLCRDAFCTTHRHCHISRHLKGLGHEIEFSLKVKKNQ